MRSAMQDVIRNCRSSERYSPRSISSPFTKVKEPETDVPVAVGLPDDGTDGKHGGTLVRPRRQRRTHAFFQRRFLIGFHNAERPGGAVQVRRHHFKRINPCFAVPFIGMNASGIWLAPTPEISIRSRAAADPEKARAARAAEPPSKKRRCMLPQV